MKLIPDPFFTFFDLIWFIAWLGIALWSEKYIKSGGFNFIIFLFVGISQIQANRHRDIIKNLTDRINALEKQKIDS